MTRAFDWNDLRFFLAVARSGTISQAGRLTRTDHATVGRRVAALEAALETQLFVRSARGYTLTRQGERLMETAGRMELEASSVEDQLGGRQQSLSGTIRLTALEGIGNFFLAPRVSALAVKHPRVSLELLTIQQIVAMSRRDTDIIVTLTPPNSRRFSQERLTDYRLFVYGTREYLSKAPPITSSRDFRNHQFAGYIDELVFTRGLDYLSEIEPGLRARLQYSSLHAQMEAASSGYGLCVLPAFMAYHRPELVPVLPHECSLLRTYWTVVHVDMASSPLIRLVLDFIRREVTASQSMLLGNKVLEPSAYGLDS